MHILADQRQTPKNRRATFTPLSGNRLRCNWNGTIIGQGMTRGAASRRWAELNPGYHKPELAPPPKARKLVAQPQRPSFSPRSIFF